MKKTTKTGNSMSIIILLFIFFNYQSTFSQTVHKELQIMDKSSYTGLPNFIKLNTGYEIKQEDFSEWVIRTLNLSPFISFRAYKTEKDDLGNVHTRYRQYFNNFPVNSTMLITHSKNGWIQSVNGDYIQNFESAYLSILSEENALEYALKKINAQKYKWENKDEENAMREALKDPSFSYSPKGELVIAHIKDASFSAQNMRLAFKFTIYAELPLYRANVFVDAITGEIILEEDLIHYADVTGTANTRYSGNKPLTTDNYGTNQYRLRETARGNGISTFNCNNGTSYTNTDFTNTSGTWNLTGSNQVATDAHYGAEKTYDYYYQTFNRNSIDGNGYALLSYVHFNYNFENAFWDGTRMTYGDGNSSNNTNPFTSLDLCGHEVTHGLTSNTAQLGGSGSGEPGALNEGFSDIFGACIEAFARPTQHDWIMGADFTTSSQFRRSMSNPNTYNQPDTYHGTNWDYGGEVHTNNGPCIYWFYLLCQGGTGTNDIGNAFNVNGITMDKASKIAYRALTVYFTSNTNYSAARGFAIQAAIDLYGSCSPEVESTTNAWYAVGVGGQYVAPAVISHFSALQTTACTLPVIIQFNNTTANGSSFTWNFGDGTTSNAQNPSHTYTAAGTYNVSLNAIGCNGISNDSEVKNNYIVINTPAVPTVNGASRCGPGAVNLSASGSGTFVWYDAQGNVLNTGANYTTPNLTANTTYYVSAVNQNPDVTGGPVSSNIGTSAAFNLTTRYLLFDVLQPCTLKKVDVNASGAGNRTIQLRDSLGNNLDSVVVNVPNGLSTITLNFPLIPGQKYQLGLSASSSANLIRNSTGAVFPYNVGSYVSITGTNATAGYYYFYYNWVIEPVACKSALVPVVATINSTSTPTGLTSQSFCAASTVSNLTANGTSIQWYSSSSGGSALSSSTSLVNGVTYYASQTVSDCESPTRLAVTVVIGTTPAPTGLTSQSFCAASTVSNLTANGNSIQWYSSSSGGSALSSSTSLVNGVTYYASQTVSGCESPTRLAVTVVIGTTPAPTGLTSQSFCAASMVSNLTANGNSIQWYSSPSGGSALSSSTSLMNGVTYYASQTVSGCESPTRLSVTVAIGTTPAPTGLTSQSFCAASTVSNLTANGNSIQWYSSPSGGSALSSSTSLMNGVTYYASQTVSGCESPTRLSVTVAIGTTPAPTGLTSQSFCAASTVSNLTANGNSIQWYSSPSGGSALSSSTSLMNGVTYYASQTVLGCESPTRLSVTVVIGTTPAPTGLTSQSFCAASTVSNLTANGNSIQWYSSSSGGSALSSSTSLVNGVTYYASQTVSGCESPTRLAVTVAINSLTSPTGPSVQNFCGSAMVSNLAAMGTSIQWYSAPSGGTPLASTVILSNNTMYYASQSNGTCESSARLVVVAVIHPNPTVSISLLPNLCTYSSPLILNQGSPAGGVYSGTCVTNGTFNPASLTTGVYPVTYIYTDQNLCSSSAQGSIVVDACAAVNETDKNAFLMYPNPASEFIIISSNDGAIKSVELFDNSGRLVVSQEMTGFDLDVKMDVNNYSEGIYTVRITSETKTFTLKMAIKQ